MYDFLGSHFIIPGCQVFFKAPVWEMLRAKGVANIAGDCERNQVKDYRCVDPNLLPGVENKSNPKLTIYRWNQKIKTRI